MWAEQAAKDPLDPRDRRMALAIALTFVIGAIVVAFLGAEIGSLGRSAAGSSPYDPDDDATQNTELTWDVDIPSAARLVISTSDRDESFSGDGASVDVYDVPPGAADGVFAEIRHGGDEGRAHMTLDGVRRELADEGRTVPGVPPLACTVLRSPSDTEMLVGCTTADPERYLLVEEIV